MDDDNDGVDDLGDDCPTDAGEQTDTDGDGYCDNADADDDNDGTYDYNDAMPLVNETSDYDGDGIGDNADPATTTTDATTRWTSALRRLRLRRHRRRCVGTMPTWTTTATTSWT